MLRASLLTVFGILLFVPVDTANAGWRDEWDAFWHRTHVDQMRNNCWPKPFQAADRAAVCETLSIQLANGWKRQNTLSDVYFDPSTQVLNEAGRRKVYTILSNSPPNFRTIYVVQSTNPEAQQRRVTSIAQATQDLFHGSVTPAVVPVRITPRSWSAEYINAIARQAQATIPAPRLPAAAGGSSTN